MIVFRKYLLLFLALGILTQTSLAKKKSKANKASTEENSSFASGDPEMSSILEQAAFIDAMQAKFLGNYKEAVLRFAAITKKDALNHEAYFQLAQIYNILGLTDEAEKAAEIALRLDPNDEWYYIFLGQIKADKEDYSGAANLYSKLVKIKSDDIDLYFDWAMLLEKADRPNEALSVYNTIQSRVGLEEVIIQKLPLYEQTKQFDIALKEVNQLIQKDSTQFQNYGLLGEVYESKGDNAMAEKAYLKILDLDPGNILAYYSLGTIYNKESDTASYRKLLTRAMLSKSLESKDKVRLMLPLMQAITDNSDTVRDKSMVIKLLQDLNKTDSNSKDISNFVAEAYYNLGDTSRAINLLKNLIQDTSATEETYIQLASMLFVDKQDYDETIRYTKLGGEKYSDNPIFDYFLALSYTIKKDYLDAQKSYQNGLLKKFDKEELRLLMLVGLGDVSGELKSYAIADSAYEKALEIDPNNALALNNYAYLLSLRNIELKRAEKMSKRSNLLENNNAAYQDTYAWILYQQEAYSEALKWIQKAMQSAGEDASEDMYDHYGDILQKLGKTNDAIDYWKKALQKNPDNQTIQQKIKSAQ